MTGVEKGEAAEREEPSHGALLRALSLALLGRATLSFLDAASVARNGVGFVQIGGSTAAESSPLWGVLWGSLAALAALLLSRRQAFGWLFGAAVCVAYLVVGVTLAVAAGSARGGLPAGVWVLFAADVALPALALAGLFALRPWFLSEARRLGRERRTRSGGDAGTDRRQP